jgi:hypothetical protein
MTANKHIGSDFDEFLAGEGLLAEAEATAVKRIIAPSPTSPRRDWVHCSPA